MTARLALLCVALSACVGADGVSVTLTPETSEVETALRVADARWESAGVAPDRIVVSTVGGAGAAVRVVPDRPASKTNVVGKGRELARVKSIGLNSLDADMVAHEMGHALGLYAIGFGDLHPRGPECDTGAEHPHAGRPLMCAIVGGVIDEATLSEACDVGACVAFNPEAGADRAE